MQNEGRSNDGGVYRLLCSMEQTKSSLIASLDVSYTMTRKNKNDVSFASFFFCFSSFFIFEHMPKPAQGAQGQHPTIF
jgi:hypothetical protein